MTVSEQYGLSGYRVVAELGSGASGRVVSAVHEASGREVALKFLAPRLLELERFVTRFRDEARLLQGLDHPNLIRFYEYVETDDSAVIVMELVQGGSLRALLDRQGPAAGPVAALAVLSGSLRGLAAAHQAGVVHRDYKPENVLVRADGVSKLTDFGIAAPAGQGIGASGTPHYMAPEQWSGRPADPASDVYAATAVFFECLTGRRPYGGTTLAQIAAAHQSAPIPLDEVPGALHPLLRHGLAKSPAERPPSADAFLDELGRLARDSYGPDWEAIGLAALGTATAALAGAGGAALLAGTAGTAGTAQTTASTTTARTVLHGARHSRRALLKTTGGKVAAGVTATVVAGGAVAGVVIADHHPAKRTAVPSSTPGHVVLAATPLAPLSGNAARYRIVGQYPQVSGMSDQALQSRINAAIEGPVRDWAASVGDSAADYTKYFGAAGAPKQGETLPNRETTTLAQAGVLLTVTYAWSGPDNLLGGGGKILVVRLDTGAVLPSTAILAPAARTTSGVTTLTNEIVSGNPEIYPACPRPETAQVQKGLQVPLPKYTVSVEVGVTAAGIDLWYFPGAQNCAPKPTVVPFTRLTGLVDPQVLRLVADHHARLAGAASE